MMHTFARDLRGRTDGSCGIKHVELDPESEMSTPSPDDIVLIAEPVERRIQTALGRKTILEGLTLERNVRVRTVC